MVQIIYNSMKEPFLTKINFYKNVLRRMIKRKFMVNFHKIENLKFSKNRKIIATTFFFLFLQVNLIHISS